MILSRYLLMLSFNNCLDVVEHLPYLFHAVTFLVHTGPINMRASIHGLVINVIHSLCTCSKPTFSGKSESALVDEKCEFIHFRNSIVVSCLQLKRRECCK